MNTHYVTKIGNQQYLVAMDGSLRRVLSLEEEEKQNNLKKKGERFVSKKRFKFLLKRGEMCSRNEDGDYLWQPGYSTEANFICPKCGCFMFDTGMEKIDGSMKKVGRCKGGTYNKDEFSACNFRWNREDDREVFREVRRWTPWFNPTDKKLQKKIPDYAMM